MRALESAYLNSGFVGGELLFFLDRLNASQAACMRRQERVFRQRKPRQITKTDFIANYDDTLMT